MRVYVLNLRRRRDRRDWMAAQADRLGLDVTFVTAFDAERLAEPLVRRSARSGRMGPLTPGEIARVRGHQLAWAALLMSGDRRAVVLEDDVELSADAGLFLGSGSWIPFGARLVKLERFGGPRHRVVMAAEGDSVAFGRRLRRFHSKNVGAAAYVLSRSAAQALLERCESADLPLDHLLFDPAVSPVFDDLAPLQLWPAIAQQSARGRPSDLQPWRAAQRRPGLPFLWREMLRGLHDVRRMPALAWQVLGRGDVLERPLFDPGAPGQGTDRTGRGGSPLPTGAAAC